MSHLTTEQQLHQCPDCKCLFVQPFKCTTCGAEKLYDATVRSQAAQIECLLAMLESAKPILWDFARENPVYEWRGEKQDPHGIHELLRKLA